MTQPTTTTALHAQRAVYYGHTEPQPESPLDHLPATLDTSRPSRVSVSVTGRRDYLGGLEWSAGCTRYFGPMKPHSVNNVEAIRDQWWRSAYLLDRVQAHLGAEALAALLAWLRDDTEYHTANRMSRAGRRNPGWLETQQRRTKRLILQLLPRRAPVPARDDLPDILGPS